MTVSTKTLRIYTQNQFSGPDRLDSVQFVGKKNLLEILNENKISIHQSCGGHAICTTCRVLVRQSRSALAVRNQIEQERATERAFNENERLACQLEIQDDLEISIPKKAD